MGVILALQSSDAVHVEVDNLGVVRHVGRLLDGCYRSLPFELVTDGDFLVLFRRMLDLRGRDTVRITMVKGHADQGMVLDGWIRELDSLGTMLLMRQLTLVGGGSVLLLSMLVVISQGFVVGGILLFLIFIGFSLPFLGLWSIMMVGMVLPLILWCGLLVLCPRGDGWFMLFVTWLCFLGLLLFVLVNGLLVLLLQLVLILLLSGHTLLVFWLNGWPFLVHCIGLLGVWTLVLVVFLLLSYSFY